MVEILTSPVGVLVSSVCTNFRSFFLTNRGLHLPFFLNVLHLSGDVHDIDETCNTYLYLGLLLEPTWVEAIVKMVHLLSALTLVQ